jgi:hypothetical protein
MMEKNFERKAYDVVLKTGDSFTATRLEEPGKNLIGLWKWSTKQVAEVVADFEDGLHISCSTIAMVREKGLADD